MLILSAEDDVADMMVPRLVAAGANLKYVKEQSLRSMTATAGKIASI